MFLRHFLIGIVYLGAYFANFISIAVWPKNHKSEIEKSLARLSLSSFDQFTFSFGTVNFCSRPSTMVQDYSSFLTKFVKFSFAIIRLQENCWRSALFGCNLWIIGFKMIYHVVLFWLIPLEWSFWPINWENDIINDENNIFRSSVKNASI